MMTNNGLNVVVTPRKANRKRIWMPFDHNPMPKDSEDEEERIDHARLIDDTYTTRLLDERGGQFDTMVLFSEERFRHTEDQLVGAGNIEESAFWHHEIFIRKARFRSLMLLK